MILCPLPDIAKHLIGLVQFPQAVGPIGARIDIRIVFPGQTLVRGLDDLLLGVAADLENGVVVPRHKGSP
jgi:hypothetical protein